MTEGRRFTRFEEGSRTGILRLDGMTTTMSGWQVRVAVLLRWWGGGLRVRCDCYAGGVPDATAPWEEGGGDGLFRDAGAEWKCVRDGGRVLGAGAVPGREEGVRDCDRAAEESGAVASAVRDVVSRALQRPRMAASLLTEALQMEPGNARSVSGLAMVSSEAGYRCEGAEYAAKAIAADPKLVEAHEFHGGPRAGGCEA